MIRLQNFLKMSSRRICDMSWRRFEDVLKTSWRGLENVLKTSWKCLEDVLKTFWQGVLKTSWRCMDKTNILVLTWRRMINKDIFLFIKTSSSRRMFAGMILNSILHHRYLTVYWIYLVFWICHFYTRFCRKWPVTNVWLFLSISRVLIWGL